MNKFNYFITNVAQTLAIKLGPAKANYKDFVKSPIKVFFIISLDPDDVRAQPMSLDDSQSPDLYKIPMKVVKFIGEPLSYILADLINDFFSSGIHPSLQKFAKVIP